MIVSEYLHSVFNAESFVRMINYMMKELKSVEYDAIAFRGTSGAALAFPLSYLTGKPLIHARKPGGHSKNKLEGIIGVKTYIVVDDFVDTGKTLRVIKNRVISHHKMEGYNTPICVGVLLYNSDSPYTSGVVKKIFPEAKLIERII